MKECILDIKYAIYNNLWFLVVVYIINTLPLDNVVMVDITRRKNLSPETKSFTNLFDMQVNFSLTWWRKLEYPEKTTDLLQVTGKSLRARKKSQKRTLHGTLRFYNQRPVDDLASTMTRNDVLMDELDGDIKTNEVLRASTGLWL
jgi:hypothetical protein